VVPIGNEGFAGVIAIETRVAAVTDTVALPATLSNVAVMVAVPADKPMTAPAAPAAFETATTLALLEDQVTLLVRSTLLLSE
jgi:hypothetical protein